MTGYYDLVLGVIPLALVGITGVLAAIGFPLTAGVMFGSVASIGVIGHAMFVNGPVEDAPQEGESARTSRTTTPNAGSVQGRAAD